MSSLNTPAADVGVIIGRFQVHELHEAHLELIDSVRQKHDRTLIFIGLSPLRNTTRNPMDYNTRRKMILESFPDVEVYYVEDNRSDQVWSANLDREITKWLKPHQTVVLYGSRDSFISYYSGKYPTIELQSSKIISGSEIRRRIANSFAKDKSYRAGVISATFDRYPTCYTTVDIAITNEKNQVLLGKKPGENALRFVGGFTSPDSDSFEEDARREVMEETGLSIDTLRYVGSAKIDDWRYKSEIDKIKTMFFVGIYMYGAPEAADDIEYVEWVNMTDLFSGKIDIVPEHIPLVVMLGEYIASQSHTKAL
jgi:bifunctional NMN adenylyltransferase/nudix hydrolase